MSIFDERGVVAFVPAFARYPYEAWIAASEPIASLGALDDEGCAAFFRDSK